MKRFLASICVLLFAGFAAAQQENPPVEPMNQTPVFRVNVVSRTTKAVNYRHRGGSTTVDIKGTDLMPDAKGRAKVDSKAGRLQINQAIARNELIYFTQKSDMSTLFDDIRRVRPTQLMLVPRVAGMVYQELQAEVAKRRMKLAPEDREGRARAEAEVISSARSTFLGDRLLLIVTGTASTPKEVTEFLKRCFQVPVIDTYGTTEAGLVTFDHRVNADTVIAFKLVDVPEPEKSRQGAARHARQNPATRDE